MKSFFLTVILICISITTSANGTEVQIQKSEDGFKLLVDGKDFIIKGMNWEYYPIGTNYTYSLWEQPESFIKAVLEKEMTLLKNMGVNALRIYLDMPKKWITYIYENYGIYTMLNHTFGRYGLTIDNEWMANTEYDHPKVKELLIRETTQLAREYKNTPGLLFFLLGNENNYHIFWKDTEKDKAVRKKENTSLENRGMYKIFLLSKEKNKDLSTKEGRKDSSDFDLEVLKRAEAMYSLFNEAAIAMKAIDSSRPIVLCNGDIAFIETIKERCPDVDIFGTNMYRGTSFGDTFQRVAEELDKPLLFTEFGADAYNVIEQREDSESQAYYLLSIWKEIYANAAGIGGAKNTIGGFTFQFSDGWWKVSQTENLDVHDTDATWNNPGYHRDDDNGANNMNEEWFGICAKIRADNDGNYQLRPRAAYFLLKELHGFSPYDSGASLVQLENFFKNITLDKAIEQSKAYSNSRIKTK
ncbi:glycoside hydrolase family 2 TIM barrel-domain containing protein [Flagellimonas sp.]|uniref:glycoside hydrolase family 2 TIM barrel-domain containing protein n=1 Tax=Flagellimonas sp. TaxID=2058762 RepID=UPI003F49C95E